MTGAAINFNAASVAPRKAFDPLPSGWYNARITDSSMAPTNKPGGQMLKLELEVIDGPFAGRKVFDQLNLVNENPTAVEIAYGTLSAICLAVGVAHIQQSTAELHNIPMQIKVKLKPAEKGADGKDYDAGNEVKGYEHPSANKQTVTAGPLAGGVAGAPVGTPPWAATGAPAAAPAAYAPTAAPVPAVAPPAQFQPPVAQQPWEQPAAAVAAAPPVQFVPPPVAVPAPVTAPIMLPKAGGASYEQFRANNWTDEAMIEQGYMAAPQPIAPPAPAPVAPMAPPSNMPAPATAAPAGTPQPPWAR